MSMDPKFRSDEQWFISPIVNVRTFKETAEEELKLTNERLAIADEYEPELDTMASFLKCSTKTANKIMRDIGIEKLLEPEKRGMADDFDVIAQPSMLEPEVLKTHKMAIQRIKLFGDCNLKSAQTKKTKYYKWENLGNKLTQYTPDVPRHITGDVILNINVGHPHNRMAEESDRRTDRMYAHMKLMARGSTTLSQIRERIMCASDFGSYIEEGKESEKPDPGNFNISLYPSSFMFIHDTFYVDDSRAECIDISEEIRQFMAAKGCFGPTRVQSMTGVTVEDLTLRLGQPYLYMHSGNCEHLLIFADLRLMTKDDEQDESRYPIVTFERGGDVKCMACKKIDAGMGVENNSRLPFTPAFFCETCFKDFHFNHGQRLGEFKAFPYFHTNKI